MSCGLTNLVQNTVKYNTETRKMEKYLTCDDVYKCMNIYAEKTVFVDLIEILEQKYFANYSTILSRMILTPVKNIMSIIKMKMCEVQ